MAYEPDPKETAMILSRISRMTESHYTFPADHALIGSGVFGRVFRAKTKAKMEGKCEEVREIWRKIGSLRDISVTQVAYKVVMQGDVVNSFDDGIPADVLKEISILKSVEHPNIMRLRDVEPIPPLEITRRNKLPGVGLVFDLARTNLTDYVDGMDRTNRARLMKKFKVIMYQLVDAMHCMHSRGFLHRDLKLNNILIGKEGQILIADFGLAYSHKYTDKLDLVVGTENFRAPEIALGKSTYSFASDVWAVGCIFAHLFLGDFLLKAKSRPDTSFLFNNEMLVGEIERVLGAFDNDPESVNYFPGVDEFTVYNKRSGRYRKRRDLFDAFDEAHERLLSSSVIGHDAAELMRRMLTLDPAKRITFREAKEHPWFADRDASLRL